MSKLTNEKQREQVTLYGTIAVAVFCLLDGLRLLGGHFIKTRSLGDFGECYLRWQECAYMVRGINPFLVKSSDVCIEELGIVTQGTVPWGLFWGNLVNPGWLTFDAVKVYMTVLYAVCVGVSILVLAKFLYTQAYFTEHRQLLSICGAALVPAAYGWMDTCKNGNQAGIVACLLVWAMCACDKHEISAGFFLGLAMMKPQIAAPFFAVTLILKKGKMLASGIITVLVGWLGAGLATHTSPWTLLLQMRDLVGSAYRGPTTGMFNFLKLSGVELWWILSLDVIVCIVLGLLFWARLARENLCDEILISWGAMALFSIEWFYKHKPDYCVLFLPAVVVFVYFARCSKQATLRQWARYILEMGMLLTHHLHGIGLRTSTAFFPMLLHAPLYGSDETLYEIYFYKPVEALLFLWIAFDMIRWGKEAKENTPVIQDKIVERTKEET